MPCPRAMPVAGRRPSPWPSGARSSRSRCPAPRITSCRSRPGAWPSWPSSWSTITCHEGLRLLLREEGVSFQVIKTWKQSRAPDFEAKKNRILHLYGLIDGTDDVLDGDRRGHLRGRVRAAQPPAAPGPAVDGSGGGALVPRRRRRATSTRPHGVRHLLAADDPSRDRLYGHIKPRKRRGEFLVFLHYLRTRYPPGCGWGSCWTTSARTCRPHRPPGRRLGGGQQRRAGRCAHQRLVAEPDRSPVHRAALLHPGRHRPRKPPPAGHHDPPLHRLAKPTRSQSATTPNPRQGEGCLMRHQFCS
jgi:hypothetical protein